MPDENPHTAVRIERRITLDENADNALYVKLVQEDGHQVWSSPIYIFNGRAHAFPRRKDLPSTRECAMT